jgi:aminoglycoside 6'-N-acetyltransferase
MSASERLSLVPFDVSVDLPRLKSWLSRPHVARWWSDAEHQIAQAVNRPAGSGHALLWVGSTAAGYVRWQRVDDAVAVELDVPPQSWDADILIGEEALVGRGIGRLAVRMLCEHLLADGTAPLVGLVTSAANARAIRAFARAGLARWREYDDPRYGRCLVLVYRRSEGADLPQARDDRP